VGKILIAVFAVWSAACAGAGVVSRAAAEETEFRNLLGPLYQSFSFEAGKEPDWIAMRAYFVDEAVFIPEPEPGKPLQPADVDTLIARWQASIRSRPESSRSYTERIESLTVSRYGSVAHVNVVFSGSESGDPHARKPGVDSIQLVRVGDEWKISAFVVQYEARLE
jgi:hypothetical protein